MAKLKKVPTSPEIDFSAWECGDSTDDIVMAIERFAKETAAEFMRQSLGADPPSSRYESLAAWARFPIVWEASDGAHGPPPDDPLSIYVEIPIGAGEEGPEFSFSIRDALESYIEETRVDGSWADGLKKISEGMAALADEINSAIAEWESRKNPGC